MIIHGSTIIIILISYYIFNSNNFFVHTHHIIQYGDDNKLHTSADIMHIVTCVQLKIRLLANKYRLLLMIILILFKLVLVVRDTVARDTVARDTVAMRLVVSEYHITRHIFPVDLLSLFLKSVELGYPGRI